MVHRNYCRIVAVQTFNLPPRCFIPPPTPFNAGTLLDFSGSSVSIDFLATRPFVSLSLQPTLPARYGHGAGRYSQDETEEMVDLNGYHNVHHPNTFEFQFNDIPSPGIASPRPAAPYRAGHRYSPPEYSSGWLQPTPRNSDIPESWATTPHESRSTSPTLVSPISLFRVCVMCVTEHETHLLLTNSTKTPRSRVIKVSLLWSLRLPPPVSPRIGTSLDRLLESMTGTMRKSGKDGSAGSSP